MDRRTAFLDTSFIIALENKSDPHHARAKTLDADLVSQNANERANWAANSPADQWTYTTTNP